MTTEAPARLADVVRLHYHGPLVLCGGFEYESAERALEAGDADLLAFGVGFIANPDLVERLRLRAPWNTPDPSTFYTGGDQGYIDYPFLPASEVAQLPTQNAHAAPWKVAAEAGMLDRDMHVLSRRDWAAFDPAAIPTKAQVPQLVRWLDAFGKRPLHCLDIGCGAGGSTRLLLARGFSVVGLDINGVAISQLQHALRGAPVELHARDVASPDGLGLAPASFDAAVCQLVASVVGDAQDRAALLRNARDVLRPGGALFISFSGLSDDLNAEYASLYARDLAETGERGSYLSRDASGRVLYRTHHFARDEIEQLLAAQGFRDIQIDEQIEASSRRPDQRARFYYVTARRA